MPLSKSTLSALAFLLSSLPACSDRGKAAAPRDGRGSVVDSSNGTVVLGIGSSAAPRAYRAMEVTSGGSIVGTLSSLGALGDSVLVVTHDAKTCGANVRLREAIAAASALENVLVWVEGVPAGKRLPDMRRETLTIDRCTFEPRVLAVTSGSTINVFSRDRVVHDARFYREGAYEPVARVHTVDAGQVVPSEGIARTAGIVEVRCAEHPWARGYIAVFDHPYFAVTDRKGSFTIDSLPPGTYTVKMWHQRLAAPVEQRVAVGAGGTGRLDLALALK